MLLRPFRTQVSVFLFSLVIAGSAFNSFQSSADAQVTSYSPKIGEAHPDFYLPAIDDAKPLKLSDYRGKKILLMHFASW